MENGDPEMVTERSWEVGGGGDCKVCGNPIVGSVLY